MRASLLAWLAALSIAILATAIAVVLAQEPGQIHDDSLFDWIRRNQLWIGYPIMAFVGGATAHIVALQSTALERAQPNYWWQHILRMSACWIQAIFISLIVYYAGQEYAGLPPPLCFTITGLGSVFASEFIRWMYDRGRSLLEGRLLVRRSNGGRDGE